MTPTTSGGMGPPTSATEGVGSRASPSAAGVLNDCRRINERCDAILRIVARVKEEETT